MADDIVEPEDGPSFDPEYPTLSDEGKLPLVKPIQHNAGARYP